LNQIVIKVATWFFLFISISIIVSACQPTTSNGVSTTQDSPLLTSTEPLPTQPAPQATETEIEPQDTTSPTPNPLTTTSTPWSAFLACDVQPGNDAPPATPSPQAGITSALDSAIPPAPPAKVEAVYSADGVLLTWGGTGTDVDQFYKIYQRKQGDECWQYIGIKMIEGDNKGGYQFEVNGIVETDPSMFAITTVDIYGNESIQSMAEFLRSGS
jgi:hypothetical protein